MMTSIGFCLKKADPVSQSKSHPLQNLIKPQELFFGSLVYPITEASSYAKNCKVYVQYKVLTMCRVVQIKLLSQWTKKLYCF